jgi:NADPH-dependent curcumin reductase CurA
MKNRQIHITTLPETALTTAHFHQTETKTTQPAKDEVLLRTLLMSIDAANRAWMQGPTYRAALRAGDLCHLRSGRQRRPVSAQG